MMPKPTTLFLTLAIAACASVPRGADTATEPMIRQQLQGMLTAWNADNLDAHIAPYADDATWTTANGLLKGKAAIRESLVKGFLRDGDLVGDLSFGSTEFTRLGPDYMMTNGSFHVANLPSGRTINGQSTLIWRRDGAIWRIIHDHSS
jgi:uncharacterized protein (TIGR02246 family)